MLKKTVMTALLAGAALFAATPSSAADGWRHSHPGPVGHVRLTGHGGGFHPHARFAFRHDFRHFSPAEHRAWRGGHWRHSWRHGRWGWWWAVGGALYWYPTAVYPYPSEVSTTYYDDDSYDDSGDNGGADDAGPGDQGGGGDGSWYHCASPEGYYPYVKECRNGWEEVPAQPNDMQGGPQGGPDDRGPPPGGQYDDNDRDDQGPPPPHH